MLNYISVAIGGALGTLIRFVVTNQITIRTGSRWPIATFLVNIIGCFLIGWLAVYFERSNGPKWLQVALIAGLCGGMTTFSAFVFELFDLMQAGLNLRVFGYLVASVMLSIFALYIGMRIASA